MLVSLQSRYCGAMVGTLAGDAGGAPYENKKAAEIEADFAARGGLTLFNYVDPFKGVRQVEAGHPTDDSELTAALAQGLLETPYFNPSSIYARLRGFIHGHVHVRAKSILTDGPPYGSGGTLREALRRPHYEDSFQSFREGLVPTIPTNGSLMRCIPIPLRYRGDQERIAEYAARQSAVTHVHPEAQAACVAFSLVADALLDGQTRHGAWTAAREKIRELVDRKHEFRNGVLRDSLRRVAAWEWTQPTEQEIWPHTGKVLLSLRIALWATVTADNFLDGLQKAIAVGGDVDTYGAIAGGLLGAYYGYEEIPEDWRRTLLGEDRMVKLADELLSASVGA